MSQAGRLEAKVFRPSSSLPVFASLRKVIRARRGSANPKGEAIPRSLEGNLWLSADKTRNNMDAAEPSGARQTAESSPKGERRGAHQYKQVVLGLIFLKYISDTFDEHHGAKAEVGMQDEEVSAPLRSFILLHSDFRLPHGGSAKSEL